MEVVITSSLQQPSNGDLLQLNDTLDILKEENLISKDINIVQFKLICMHRGLNEYRKDLRVFDL
tara:strand:- start:589 stop:780 length:192 start_codon:yes stop_codon:yes gene_type:complete